MKKLLIIFTILAFTIINSAFANDKDSRSAQSNDRHYHGHNHHGHYGHHHDHYYKPHHHHKPYKPYHHGYLSDHDLRGKNYTFIRSYKEWDNIGREWITCADYHVRSETLPVKYCRYYYGWKKIGTIPYKGAIIK